MIPHKLILIPLLLVCFGLAPMAQAVGPDTDGNIPGANNGEGIGVLVNRTTGSGTPALVSRRSTTSLPVTKIRQPVFDPCLTMSAAVSTPARVFFRSIATRSAFLTLPPALIRSGITRTATATLPTVMLRSITTPEGSTRPWLWCALQHHRLLQQYAVGEPPF